MHFPNSGEKNENEKNTKVAISLPPAPPAKGGGYKGRKKMGILFSLYVENVPWPKELPGNETAIPCAQQQGGTWQGSLPPPYLPSTLLAL